MKNLKGASVFSYTDMLLQTVCCSVGKTLLFIGNLMTETLNHFTLLGSSAFGN